MLYGESFFFSLGDKELSQQPTFYGSDGSVWLDVLYRKTLLVREHMGLWSTCVCIWYVSNTSINVKCLVFVRVNCKDKAQKQPMLSNVLYTLFTFILSCGELTKLAYEKLSSSKLWQHILKLIQFK